MRVSNNTPLQFAAGFCLVIIVLICVGSCHSCNNDPKPAVKPMVQVIKDEAQPAIDSLKRANAKLQVENDSLTAVNKILQEQKIESRYRIKESKVDVAAAEEKKDTAALVTSLKKTVVEQEEYIRIADHDASVQSATIENLAEQNNNLYAEKELEKSKFNRLADHTSSVEIRNIELEKKNVKAEKKAKNWKNIGKTVIVIAVVEGILLSIK